MKCNNREYGLGFGNMTEEFRWAIRIGRRWGMDTTLFCRSMDNSTHYTYWLAPSSGRRIIPQKYGNVTFDIFFFFSRASSLSAECLLV